jgi:hypothetical protein
MAMITDVDSRLIPVDPRILKVGLAWLAIEFVSGMIFKFHKNHSIDPADQLVMKEIADYHSG